MEKPKFTRWHKASLAMSLLAVVFASNFWGITAYISLEYISQYVQESNETLVLSGEIKEFCMNVSEMPYDLWTCYRNRVWVSTPYTHTWFSNFQKGIQLPVETLGRGRGNCVDKAVLQDELFKELNFEHVYLVLQNQHVCVMVADMSDIHAIDCIPHSPILGIKRVYSAGLD